TAQRALCDMLVEQCKQRFGEAARIAENYLSYHTIAAQAVFCWLCVGDVGKARATLSASKLPHNPVSWWLRGVVLHCLALAEESRDELSKCPIEEDGFNARPLWLRIWDYIPDRVGPPPAFYFPYLPQSLTGLTHDLRRIQSDNSVFESADWPTIRLPITAGIPGTTAEREAAEKTSP